MRDSTAWAKDPGRLPRRKRDLEANNHGGSRAGRHNPGLLSTRTVVLGLLVVIGICSWQFLLITRSARGSTQVGGIAGIWTPLSQDPVETDPVVGASQALLHYAVVHEANITSLALQQQDIGRLMQLLWQEIRTEREDLVKVQQAVNNLSAQVLPKDAAAPPVPGTASSSEALAQAARRQSVINEVQTRIDQLSQNLRGVTIPAGAAGAGRVNDIGGAVNSAIGMGLPRLPGTFPAEWLKHFTQEELLASALEAENWREGTKQAFLHAWKGYHAKAWGKDEVRPVSGGEGKKWANCGMQILDALSTMWVMGLTEQFDEATKWVEERLRFDNAGMVSFFELTIRALGGLVSAHSLSGREVFLRKARELADKMLPAFRNENPGFPFTQVNLKTGKGAPGWYSGTVLSEAGTVQLEFRYISQLTGDPKYAQKADRSMRGILEAANGRGLVPWGLSRSAPRTVNSHITFGAMGDSYYEYLLKMYLQTNQTESEWLVPWKKAMSEMTKRLLLKTKGGLLYLAEENNGKPVHKMDHLACFVGGMLKYAARVLPKEHVDDSWEGNAAALTETCYQMYHRQPTHLAPECSKFEPNGAAGQDMQIYHNANHYLLRPEAAEAIFYMFYYTGDPKYRRMAGEIFEAIEKYARTTYGYSAVKDVRQASPQLKNEMETFFLAETLKYLYLTFVPNPQEVIDLDHFVLSTEAHPIRIFPPGSSPAR